MVKEHQISHFKWSEDGKAAVSSLCAQWVVNKVADKLIPAIITGLTR